MPRVQQLSLPSPDPTPHTLLHRRYHHRHAIPLNVGMRILRGAELLDLGQEAVEDGPAELHVRHLASAEADRRLDLVAVLQEADDVVLLEIEVVLVDAGAELHLLDDDHLLLLLGLALLLLLLEERTCRNP